MRIRILSVVIAVMFSFLCAAQIAHGHEITQDEVDELIDQLGDDDLEVRIEAMARLIREARESLANTQLIDARLRAIGLTSADPEVVARSRDTIQDITIQKLKKRCEIQRDGNFVIFLEFIAFDSDGIREIRAQITDETGFTEDVQLVRFLDDAPPQNTQVNKELVRFSPATAVTIIVEDRNGNRTEKDPPLVCVPQALDGSDFPIAVRGAGNSTEIIFAQGATTTAQTAVTAVLWSTDGEILETRSAQLTPNSTSTMLFDSLGILELGHMEIFSEPTVIATQILNLSVPRIGSLPPLGIMPVEPCLKPAAALRRDPEFDTGLALSNRGQESAYCDWSIYSGTDGSLVGSGLTIVPALGQTQSFPLNAVLGDPQVSMESFEGNIQFDCDLPVHPFSLFQRKADGAIFSNAAGCLDNTIPNDKEVADDPPIKSTSDKCRKGKGTRPLLDNLHTEEEVHFSYFVENTGKCWISVTGVKKAPVNIDPGHKSRTQFTALKERVVRVVCLPGDDPCEFSFSRYKTP